VVAFHRLAERSSDEGRVVLGLEGLAHCLDEVDEVRFVMGSETQVATV
jgi:hypothetical protein